jgi:hypothetical protein
MAAVTTIRSPKSRTTATCGFQRRVIAIHQWGELVISESLATAHTLLDLRHDDSCLNPNFLK